MTNSNHPLSDLINQTGTEIQEKKDLRERKEGYVSRVWFRWPLSIFKTQLTLQKQQEQQAETPIYLFIDIKQKIFLLGLEISWEILN
jgi:hypothetical protein